MWLLLLSLIGSVLAEIPDGVCYNGAGEAVRCMPDFINIAYQAKVFASDTCGSPPSEFCVQQEIGLPTQEDNCYTCDADSPEDRHPASYMTDGNEGEDATSWWQSNTLFDGSLENMTLHLPFNKSFDIEYIKVEFQSPRPESMVIEKSSDFGRSWQVYQYFSSSCYKTFNKRTDEPIYVFDETVAICTRKYSELSPLRGGVVAFSPLKNRPNAKDPEKLYNNQELLEWMRATDIRIKLVKPNTFGDQYFSNKNNDVLKTYYYAISDLSVGGRCTCHGHGGSCTSEACKCEHNTAGKNCERCKDMFNDLPWQHATVDNPFVCQECECNGLASRCVFDEDVFAESGGVSGGVCVGCRANTDGKNCELCAHGYFPDPALEVGHYDRCQACQCNVYGSIGNGACAQDLDINRGLSFGDCQCKPHVQGIHCDTCEDGYHSLQEGCLKCDCDPVGTVGDTRLCNKTDGQCKCQDHITGTRCNECLPGFWDYLNGCQQCDCDLAGSLSLSCSQATGQCACREGREGRTCSEAKEGTTLPDIDVVIIVPDDKDGDVDGNDIETPTDDSFDDYSSGETLDDPTDKITFTFSAPHDDSYTIIVKYFYPSSGTDEPANVRFDLEALDRPGMMVECIPVIFQQYFAQLDRADRGIHKLEDACLDDGVTYRLTVTLIGAIDGAVTLNGIILVPKPTAEVIDAIDEILPAEDEASQEARKKCLEVIYQYSKAELEQQFPQCVVIADIIFNHITNGSVSCDCHLIGSRDPDTCDASGGQCSCRENVVGIKCDECRRGYFGMGQDGCQECGCNEIGSKGRTCDQETGQCNCKPGVTGDKCTQCEAEKYSFGPKGCLDCSCSSIGSISGQCDEKFGQCPCKPGVGGLQCDRCKDGYYDFSVSGCRRCDCNSIGGNNLCDQVTGECRCKENVEGDRCLRCVEGSFSLQQSNPDGCQACFCYGHSDQCEADTGYTPARISSEPTLQLDWKYQVAGSGAGLRPLSQDGLRNPSYSIPLSACLVAPPRFTADQRGSYLTDLQFRYQLYGTESSIQEVVITGELYTLTLIPRVNAGDEYSVMLHQSNNWLISERGEDSSRSDIITALQFQSVLADIEKIEVCIRIAPRETFVLSSFSIGAAERKASRGSQTALNMEICTCPVGYSGSSCESCAEGYTREDPSRGRLSACVLCNCEGYSDTCDPDTGACIDCKYNTAGDNCEVCKEGYYGSPGYGNPRACRQCMCPEAERSFSNTCEIQDGRMVCTACNEGHAGDRCDVCADGYYGEPSYDNPNQHCTPCTCNGNIDPTAEDNCNTVTGQCLKCIGNTAGRQCEQCARGYYGDAVNAKDCSKCICDGRGSYNPYLCDTETGQCNCKPHVVGQHCDRCKFGFYNLDSTTGCEPCNCDPLGSVSLQCSTDGTCLCHPGYFGLTCAECSSNHYYLPGEGCTPCNCNPDGSESLQCDRNGQCPCKGTVQGRQCDMCPRNMVNITAGCVNCPDCYSLVEREVDLLKDQLQELREVMGDTDSPTMEASPDFKGQIEEVQAAVDAAFDKAQESADIATQLESARKKIEALVKELVRDNEQSEGVIAAISETVASSEDKLAEAADTIDNISGQLDEGVRMLLEEGEAALARAEENMNTLSEENKEMQRKAQQARTIAQRQEAESRDAVTKADQALELAESAFINAKAARSTLRDTKSKLDSLVEEVGEIREEYELAKNAANNYIAEAEDALSQAETLADQACNAGPDTDLSGLKESLRNLDRKANKAVSEAEQLKNSADLILEEAEESIAAASELLEEGEETGSDMKKLKKAAKQALRESTAAAEECTDLIQDAQKLLEVLQNYEREVDRATERASDAVAQLDELEEAVDTAEEKVESASESLGDGKKDMGALLASINRAKDTLDDSLDQARQIADKVGGLVGGSESAVEDATALRAEVAAALAEVQRLRQEAQNGSDQLKGVLREAGNAKATADSIASTLETGDSKLRSIQSQLEDIQSEDSERLQELIDALTAARDTMDEEGIDAKIGEMVRVSEVQAEDIEKYRAEIRMMKEEIASLEAIETTIPDTSECFNPNLQ